MPTCIPFDANWLQGYAETATALIAFSALAFTAVQLVYLKVGYRNNAESLWREYERLALDHPKMAKPEQSVVDTDEKTFDGNPEEFTRYEYFVSILLWAGESILEVYTNQPDWRASVREEVALHKKYVKSPYFKPTLETTTKRRIRDLITEEIAV